MLEDSNRKIIVLALTIVLAVSTIGFYTWYTQYRNWSIEELDSKVFKQSDPDIHERQPYFESDRAGEEITVKGEVTSLSTLATNQGMFTEIELDDYEELTFLKKGSFDHDVGDKVTIDMKFKKGYLNGKKRIFSPQFHPDFIASSIQNVIRATNNVSGYKLDQNMTSDQILRISIEECFKGVNDNLPVDLNETTCSLYSGTDDFRDDYKMCDGENIRRPDEQLMVDYGQLSNGKKEGKLKFYDENNNGMLDKGDYFEIDGLERPNSSLSFNTYHLLIENENFDSNPPPWNSYIIMNESGLLRCKSLKSS